ncbi:MAG: hypothetical protein AAB461_01010 [Patescibacteria group bacterium]
MAKINKVTIVVAISLSALIIAFGAVGVWYLRDFVKYDRYDKNDFIDPSTYQAVFLANDQIYFGYLKNIEQNYLMLSDVYYIKIGEGGDGQLVKLGAIEPHGPKDKMIINRDQVLFWENMRFDSQVVKTIQSIQQK